MFRMRPLPILTEQKNNSTAVLMISCCGTRSAKQDETPTPIIVVVVQSGAMSRMVPYSIFSYTKYINRYESLCHLPHVMAFNLKPALDVPHGVRHGRNWWKCGRRGYVVGSGLARPQ